MIFLNLWMKRGIEGGKQVGDVREKG